MIWIQKQDNKIVGRAMFPPVLEETREIVPGWEEISEDDAEYQTWLNTPAPQPLNWDGLS